MIVDKLKKLTRFQKAIGLAILIVMVVSVFDFFMYPKSFWLYSGMMGVIAATVYYIFKKDKSEAVAVFAAFYIMLMTGLEDLVFYIIRPLFQDFPFGIPESMPHLFTHPTIGRVAQFMGLDTVTPTALIVTVMLGAIVTYFTVTFLKNKL